MNRAGIIIDNRFLFFFLLCSAALFFACKQRPPQNGTVEKRNDDGSVSTSRYENGRLTYRLLRTPDGKKISEEFGTYLLSSVKRTDGYDYPDKDSTIRYGEGERVMSIYTTFRPPDGSPAKVSGRSFHPDGSLASVVDAGGMTIFYPSGRIQFEQIPIGENALRQVYYDSLGTVREEWENLNGVRHGKRRLFDSRGKIIVDEQYDRGNLIRQK